LGRSCPIHPARHVRPAPTTSAPHRARCAAGALACFGFAAAYLVEAWRIIFSLRIGPVIAVIDEAHGHGIHSGDMLGLGCAIVAVMLVIGGAILLDDATGTAAHLAPAVVRSRSRGRHRRTIPVLATPIHRATRSTHRHRARSRSRRAWNTPVAAA